MKLVKEQEFPLLDRKVVYLESHFDRNRTPSGAEVKAQISALLSIKTELIAVRKIYQRYGQNKIDIVANVYKSIEALKSLEAVKKKPKKEEAKPIEKKKEPKEGVKEDAKEGKAKEQGAK